MDYYRYASELETSYVRIHSRVPNTDLFGLPKVVFFTDVSFTSASKSEDELLIGSKNPTGPHTTPTNRFDLDLTGISYAGPMVILGSPSSANEYKTTGSPFVTTITKLTP